MTATTSRRRATKHVRRVSPYSPASVDLCGSRRRRSLAIAYGKNGLGRSVLSACFFTANGSEKRGKKQPITATSNRHSDPHRASHFFKAARSRWKESQTRSELGVTSCRPLWARHRLGRRVSPTSKKMRTSRCLTAFWGEPQDQQSQGTKQ